MASYDTTAYGAIGDGSTINSPAIQRAIDACHQAGGGTVLVPAGGTFLTGQFTMKSNVELHIERGATLACSGNPADFPRRILGRWVPFIDCDRAENIAFTGSGTIDGGGRHYIAERTRHIYRMKGGRPFMFFLCGAKGVTFRDITIRDAAVWTVRLSGCEDVVIHGIRILNDLVLPNNDGIDLDRCRNVRISACHIEAGDDCICLKADEPTAAYGTEWGGRCENITVTGCTLVSTSSALIIGCEVRSPIRNVVFDACVITRSHRGLAIHLSDPCDVENITFSNMIVETRLFHPQWWGRAEPIYVTAIPWTADRSLGRVRNVRFINVIARGENGVFVQGWAADRIDGLLLENVRVELDRWSSHPGGEHDIRPYPQDPGGAGPVGDGVYKHPTAGFFLKNARNVTLRNCEVAWMQRPDNFRHALESHGVEDLRLEGFEGAAAHPDRDAAVVRD
jgi:hypothetical protein